MGDKKANGSVFFFLNTGVFLYVGAPTFLDILLIILILAALFAPWIAPHSYSYQNLDLGATPPSGEFLLGTDTLGRDLLSRILYGARVSLLVGFVATAVALVIGVSWGIIAGYFGGRIDSVMMRIVDVLYGLPFIIFIILLILTFVL